MAEGWDWEVAGRAAAAARLATQATENIGEEYIPLH
jgi:hypothetical protein